MRKRSLIVFGAAVVAAAMLGVGSRALNEASDNAVRTDGLLRIGVVGDFRRRHSPDAEFLAGVQLWRAQLAETGGIPYNVSQIAAVRLLVANDRGLAVVASNAARDLVRRGADILFGPPHAARLAAVADAASALRTPLFSPIPRPLEVPRSSLFTFLDRPRVGDFSAALDALDVATRGTPRGEVLILMVPGDWGLAARRTARLVSERGYTPSVVRVAPAGLMRVLADAGRRRLQAVFASAPFRLGLIWFRMAKSDVPWVLAARDVRSALALNTQLRVAVAVPWSPTREHGGDSFSPGEFTEMYGDAYGRLPTIDAAAGAALGTALSNAVQLARSTDTSRILAAREQIAADSILGRISFANGEDDADYPQAVLLEGRQVRPITPDRLGAQRLKASVPTGATALASP
jgi:ABC-type branched-subunit amino acid transport system substrate-binding protein